MKHIVTFILIINSLIISAQSREIDWSYTILELDTSDYCAGKLEGFLKSEFNENDFPLIDSLLQDFIIQKTNPSKPFHCGTEIHDYKYYYQYVALENSKGENIVWVNAFSPSIIKLLNTTTRKEKRRLEKGKSSTFTPFDWHKQMVCGHDGCGSFWELKINITNRTIFEVNISGI